MAYGAALGVLVTWLLRDQALMLMRLSIWFLGLSAGVMYVFGRGLRAVLTARSVSATTVAGLLTAWSQHTGGARLLIANSLFWVCSFLFVCGFAAALVFGAQIFGT